MGHDESIAELRSRMTDLVEQEGALLTQAFDLSRGGGDRKGIDALFARVQAIQVERNSLKKRIGNILGTQRLHAASEVWRPGVYDYRQDPGSASVRVRIQAGPLGLLVLMPGRAEPLRIETLDGSFDGPLAVDDAAHPEPQAGVLADPAEAAGAAKGKAPKRPPSRKK